MNQRFFSRRIWPELLILLLYLLLSIIVTSPTILHITDSAWLADSVNDPDAFIKLWDAWYLERLLAGEQEFFRTNLLFAPDGLDLTYHTFNLPHIVTVYLLTPLAGSRIAAFNLTGILFTALTAYSGFVLIRYLLKANLTPRPPLHFVERGSKTLPAAPDFPWQSGAIEGERVRAAAFYGGCVFGFSQWVVHNFRHPDLSLLVTLALGLLLFIHACRTLSLPAGIGAGALLGITAYIGMYIVVVMALMMAGYTLISLRQQARIPQFWLMLALCGTSAVVMAAPRVLPMMQGNLRFVLEDKYSQYHQWESIDLVNFFLPAHHPVWGKAWTLPEAAQRYHMFYLGWMPLALTIMGLLRRRCRREALFWMGLLVFFMWPGMGTILNINGIGYPQIPMLKGLLDRLPVIFAAFGRPDNFQTGVVLPLAIASAYGLYSLFNPNATAAQRKNPEAKEFLTSPLTPEAGDIQVQDSTDESQTRPSRWLIVGSTAVLTILTLFELSVGPYPGADVMKGISPFYQQVAQEAGDFGLIQLPMGRTPSKSYLLYQTLHGKPVVEGLASRTPAEAYDFINGNALLSAWNRRTALDCQKLEIAAALDELIRANFRYVIIQKNYRSAAVFLTYFPGIAAVYEDSGLVVYRLADLQAKPPCP